jgi:hypothetical protein
MLYVQIVIALTLVSLLVGSCFVITKAVGFINAKLNEFIKPLHQILNKKAFLNNTYYFNDIGEAVNLNTDSWAIGVEGDHRTRIINERQGIFTIFVRKNKIIFDKITVNFNLLNEKHKDFPVCKYIVELMSSSKLNYDKVSFQIINAFVHFIQTNGAIYNSNLFALAVNATIELVRPDYEESLKPKLPEVPEVKKVELAEIEN